MLVLQREMDCFGLSKQHIDVLNFLNVCAIGYELGLGARRVKLHLWLGERDTVKEGLWV